MMAHVKVKGHTTHLFGELDMATVFPGVREAGLIVMEMGEGNESEEWSWKGCGLSGETLGLLPLGRRKILQASRRRRKTEKIEASGSFCSSSSIDCRKYFSRSKRPL